MAPAYRAGAVFLRSPAQGPEIAGAASQVACAAKPGICFLRKIDILLQLS